MRNEIILKEALFSKVGEEFETVALPHTWNALDGQDGGDDYWRGHGLYKIALPNPTQGMRQYIQFEGANHVAFVTCNGTRLGMHKGGFSTFRFDLTDIMKAEDNELVVEVTNEECDVYPQQADFTFFGGLYRNVTFIEVPEIHFDLLKGGTNAVFVTPHAAGLTRVDAFPVNAEGCMLAVDLKDAEGSVVASQQIPAQAHSTVIFDIDAPHLWDGLDDPYMYTAEARLEQPAEEEDAPAVVMDTVSVQYGYRSFHVDPENGFFLNGRSYPLHGVSRHQDRLDKGWAISEEDHREDLELIKEVGANTIRLAHYQHAQFFYNLCDAAGMVLWAEIPFISLFREGDEAKRNTMTQMAELISQNYNHPSICFWGISNEITIGGESEALYQNLCDLNALAKRMDPSRLTTMAQVSMVPMNSEHVYITDVQSYNHYFGWYGGEISDNGAWMDEFHKKNPDRALGISEYGAEAILTWHSAKPENHDYTEEYQAHYHHELLKTFESRPYLWSTHVWNMFDFAADARDEGGCKGRNNKGLVTYDRKTKKDSFYLYQAYWTKKPMVHICGSRFVDRAPDQRDVTVYTNCAYVTLMVNGKRVAQQKAQDHACVFRSVELVNGENHLTAHGENEAAKLFSKPESVVQDSIVLNGVNEPNPDYVLPVGAGDAGNWFDESGNEHQLVFPEGCCSIHDKLGELLDHPEAGPVLTEMISKMADQVGMGKNIKGMLRMMRSMRLEDIIKMAGKKLPAGMAVQLNDILIQFKK